MSHRICNIHVATSRLPIQRLLTWHISKCTCGSSCGSQGLPRHTIMWNLLGSTWKSRSDSEEHWKGAPHSGEHWKGAPPFVFCQCFPNIPTALACLFLDSSPPYDWPLSGGILRFSSLSWGSSPRSLRQTVGSPELPPCKKCRRSKVLTSPAPES